MTSLESWHEQGRLRKHSTSDDELRSLWTVFTRDVGDAQLEALSLDARVHCAYQAARVLCDLALRANGYRVPAGRSQHEYVLRSLSLTLGTGWERMVDILNAARATRARSEYESAGTATEAQLTELQEQIAVLQPAVVEALRAKGYSVS